MRNRVGIETRDIGITGYSLVTCLGYGVDAHRDAMLDGRSGLSPCTVPGLPFECFVGSVGGLDALSLPDAVADFDNRANRLAFAALEADEFRAAVAGIRERWGAERCGVVIGTSTSGVEKLEQMYRDRDANAPLAASYMMKHHDNHQAIAAFLQTLAGFAGPSYTISTACSSSAKALVDAVQLIQAGYCDAVLTGGADSLCLISLNGFEAMQLIDREPCRPCDANRHGLTIGEGAAFMIVERDAGNGIRLSGYGESSDGVSMSTPPEDGAGAAMAMRAALDRAGLAPDRIGYVNLHGTATLNNDTAECAAVSSVLGNAVPASSLKGAIGHTLGAAGAIETVMCLIAQENGFVPGCTGLETLDPEIGCDIVRECRPGNLSNVVSNAFGFGGNNCVLVLSR
jgi:3-oxoacyl-[acyl-carrier-protein] synthase-1